MRLIRDFGSIYYAFNGTQKALDTFTLINKTFNDRGYRIAFPSFGQTEVYSIPGVGKVSVHRRDEGNCDVTFLEGALLSKFLSYFQPA